MNLSFKIDNRIIGGDAPPYVIAEMSGNHNGSIERAFALLDAAKSAGADAVKLQTYTADTITIDHSSEEFCISEGLWAGKSLYELYHEAHTPWEWHGELFRRARKLGITLFSSPFDATAVELLESLDTPAYKIASFEVVDLPLIRCVASTGKPIIISTGMANMAEIREAVDAARDSGARDIALLHCVSGYPTPVVESNLRCMAALANEFGTLVGLSDHTMGTATSVAAVALGACIIEKHFTLRRADGGPDAAFSLEPGEFRSLTGDCRAAWESLGMMDFNTTPSESPNIKFRRSLYVVADMRAGEQFSRDNVRSIRPGYGLPPKLYPDVIGQTAAQDIRRGTALQWDLICKIKDAK